MRILESYERLARILMEKHGLRNWQFSYNSRLKRTLGLCYGDKNLIELNPEFVKNSSHSVITDVILHEISHALVGVHNQHNIIWKHKFRELGGSGKRLVDI